MEDILSNDPTTIKNVIEFLIQQAKRLYHQKNIKRLMELRMEKIIENLVLQMLWGEEWEKKKSVRKADDPTNNNPGTPKHTH